MARNKKSRKNKKYDPSKAKNVAQSLQPENAVNQNLTPEQIQAEEVLYSLLERKIEIP